MSAIVFIFRALVHKLSKLFGLIVVTLVDFNPFGVGVYMTYKIGSTRMALDSVRYGVDAKLVGITTSDIQVGLAFRLSPIDYNPSKTVALSPKFSSYTRTTRFRNHPCNP